MLEAQIDVLDNRLSSLQGEISGLKSAIQKNQVIHRVHLLQYQKNYETMINKIEKRANQKRRDRRTKFTLCWWD